MFATRPSAFSDDEARLLAGEDKLPKGMGEFKPQEENGDLSPVTIGDSGIPEKMLTKAVTEADIDEILEEIDAELMAIVLLANSRAIIAEL